MDYALIQLQVERGIATITFNRPEKRNAMSDELRTEFIHALERVAGDKGIRALVLTGAGKGFCAGGDIAGMERRMNAQAGEIAFNGWHRQQRVHHTQALLHTMPKPVIAAVNGAASGLGADTALACDFIIAAVGQFHLVLHPPRASSRTAAACTSSAPGRPAEARS
jgi:enoyl-CoA hydratase/carnithine racemase